MRPIRTYCNPLPLPDYQWARHCRKPGFVAPSCREMADPTVIKFKGRWYLFPSAGMLWHSDDMVNWTHAPIEPFDPGYAPTVVVHCDWLYMSSSWDGSAIWRARDPMGSWERLGERREDADGGATWLVDHEGNPFRWGDPCLFSDDDGALYCYCNMQRPTRPEDNHPWKLHPDEGVIFGVRLDPDEPFRCVDAPVRLIAYNPAHWWERRGEHNQLGSAPVMEGAWMAKHEGRYYLQYSGNGTEFKNYAVGCTIGDGPLGPFVSQAHNPILIHRGGLVNGTAHHSTVEGPDGRLWCFYTCRVNNVHPMERRIGMDPIRFLRNGEMAVDGPTEAPRLAPSPSTPGQPDDVGLVALSVNMRSTAATAAPGRDARYAFDDAMQTWWQPADTDAAPWIEVDLDDAFDIHSARIIFGDEGLDYVAGIAMGPYTYTVCGSLDGKEWHTLCDQTANAVDRHIAYETWPPSPARHIRLAIHSAPTGMRIALWELTVFGRYAERSGDG